MKAFLILFFALILTSFKANKNELIIDSKMTWEEAIAGTKAPKELLDSIKLLNIKYLSFDKKIHQGQILVNIAVAEDVEFFFNECLKHKFPIAKVIPIVKYNWDDDASMEDNNSSALNYRFVANTTRLSNHSFGRAIDINPFINPVIYSDGKISPKGAKYNKKKSGAFHSHHPIVKAMIAKGWTWGGNWNSLKDNHHFEKK